ncbi:dipeptide epimerase [Vibrio mediterranei]|jgi:L-alanine-DL-glutamate epimerase-like enolase superfamily enzyme|uniref:mandelate racemase/muconate lactonizing enzyme family protein n=1 Tax=Vibrio mediterranei TaxID=689 RepID=UPI001EFC7145|nr:dipeptide epimerase [Vibrio mediterranei]MCG9629124.1 dipeptide epimerase [Vibrio mediterranei]MCY9855141.1 dipeptide epimerase [Vibrio mediterranei]
MKITAIETKIVDLSLLKPIKVSLGTINTFQTLLLRIKTDIGLVGYGEASPIAFVTGETITICQDVIKTISTKLIGLDVSCLERIHAIMDSDFKGNYSSKAAIDIALHDLLAQQAKLPLYQYLGGGNDRFLIDKTISIDTPEVMAEEALRNVNEGFRILKIKLGSDINEDIKRLEVIRATVSDDIILRVDANQGWETTMAIKAINAMAELNIEAVEQPLKYWNLRSHKTIRNKTTIPLMADESLFTPMDAIELVRQDCVDIFNIKLMKCGGLYKAAQINAIAENAGYTCMVGCMLESWIGITAAASFIAAKNNITKADIDSVMHIKANGISSGLRFDKGMALLSNEPGLGINVEWD